MAHFPKRDLSDVSLWMEKTYGLTKFPPKISKSRVDEQVASIAQNLYRVLPSLLKNHGVASN